MMRGQRTHAGATWFGATRYATLLATLVASLFLFAAVGNATIHDIQVGNNFFAPLGTTVMYGDTVRWTWDGGIPHSVTSENDSPKAFDSGISSAAGFQFQITIEAGDGPGPFPYFCQVHAATMKDTIFVALPPEPTVYTFKLDQQQADECAGTDSDAIGYGLAILSADSSELSFTIHHSVSSPTAAHVHLGAPCVDGGISFPFASAASPIVESWALSSSDVADLVAGNLYVNVHSGAFPGGEIRGQIVQAPLKFIFPLDEAQAAAGAGTNSFASGFAIMELSAASDELSVDITHDVTNVTVGHIHLGAPGVGGPPVFGFSDANNPVSETWSLDTTDIKDLIAGDLYVNIHSDAFPNGEIRGQLANPELLFVSRADGDQADAGMGTGSEAVGFGVFVLRNDRTELRMHIEHDVANVLTGHIHLGAVGVSGPPQFTFGQFTSPITETWVITPSDLDNFLTDMLYFNIHSDAFPGGEIRGQLEPLHIENINFPLDEEQADTCAGTGSAAVGDGDVSLKAGGREMTVEVTHDVSDPIAWHVHLGFQCVGGGAQFTEGASTSPIQGIWYLTEADIINLMQQELYVNVHSNAFPAGEIRGQIGEFIGFGCCEGLRGNLDGSPDDTPTLGDLTVMIDHLFISLAPLDCWEEGNVDESIPEGPGSVTLGDLTVLIDNLFISLAPPPACP